jgi:hypothetical protein
MYKTIERSLLDDCPRRGMLTGQDGELFDSYVDFDDYMERVSSLINHTEFFTLVFTVFLLILEAEDR